MQKVLILVLITACVSCSSFSSEDVARTTQSAESVRPTMPVSTPDDPPGALVPMPNFPGWMWGLDSKVQHYELISDEICLYLEESSFWEPGDYWLDMEDLPPVTMLLDDNTIEHVRRFRRGVGTREFDEEGKEIGIHLFTMDYCFTPELQPGTHLLKVEVTTTSGINHSLALEFEVVGTQ